MSPDWGFYGHRKINRLAVFTLPPEMFGFFKHHIEYVTAHAVDPDKRRYALKNEYARHYIDIDHWDTIPFTAVPRDLGEATMKYGTLVGIDGQDSVKINIADPYQAAFYKKFIWDLRYDSRIGIQVDTLAKFVTGEMDKTLSEFDLVYFENTFVQFGIAPYFFVEYYNRLVRAFEEKNIKYILKIGADIGHYLGDAHVPLHTTLNYNGQLTDQIGIHAFWESRLPELYADETYDFVVGKAYYIDDIETYIWQVITDSHSLLPDVLRLEKELQKSFSPDQQFCFDERLERTIKIQCPEYCAAYHEALDGMVEKRMRDAVLGIGSVWYSAWIDAGQPTLELTSDMIEDAEEEAALNNAVRQGESYGRKHN